MRFFVVPGIGQLELNRERSSGRRPGERMVRSPPKLRPAAATLSYYGYSVPCLCRCKDTARKDGLPSSVCLTANDGPLPTDYLGPHFGDGGANDGNDVSFGPSDVLRILYLGLIAALAIKSRFHPASLTTKLDASRRRVLRGPFSDPGADTHMQSGRQLF